MTQPEGQPAPPPQVLWILWGTLLVSLGVYGLLPLVLDAPISESPPPETITVATFGLLGGGTALATLVLRRVWIVRPARAGALDVGTPGGLIRFFRLSIVLWVLCESVGLYGLVVFVLYGSPVYLYVFLAAAAALMIHHAPRVDRLRAATRGSSALARPDVTIG